MMRKLALITVFLLVCGARLVADGGTCSISATSVVFGSYAGGIVNVTGTLSVRCPFNTAYAVGLSAGASTGATVTNRRMTGPASALLGYGLYSDAGYTANWGDTSSAGWVTRTGTGNTQTLTVYAQIPANQYSGPGSYSDTIRASVVSPTGLFQTVSVNFNVTATVTKACTISAASLVFGAYSGALITSTSIISATCTNGTTYNIGLSAGTAIGATVTKRSMTGPAGALLGYKIFSNSTYTTNWGNTVGTDTVTGTGSGLVKSHTVYGQIPAGESGAPGSYNDTITATITY